MVKKIFVHKGIIKDVVFSIDDMLIVARSFKTGDIRIWDVESRYIRSSFNDVLNKKILNVNGIKFTKDGKELLYWGGDEEFYKKEEVSPAKIFLWNIDTRKEKLLFTHDRWVYGAKLHKDEQEIWSWGVDGRLKIWDRKNEHLIFQLYNKEAIYKTKFQKNENSFFTFSKDGKVKKRWHIRKKIETFDLKHNSKMIGIVFSKNGQRFISWDESGLIKLWDTKELLEITSFNYHGYVWGVKFSNNESLIFAWKKDGSVKKFDIKTNKEIVGNSLKEKRHHIGKFEVNNERISWTNDKIIITNLKNDENWILLHDTEVRKASIHLNKSKSILLSCDKHSVRLWDMKSKNLLLTLNHNDIIDAKFSDDEREVMSWGYNGDRKVFKLYKDRELDVKDYLLEAQVQSGVELENGKIKPLSVQEWKIRKAKYQKIIEQQN